MKTSDPRDTPRLSDEERHARFKQMAREVEASENPEDFEAAFECLTADKLSLSKSRLDGPE